MIIVGEVVSFEKCVSTFSNVKYTMGISQDKLNIQHVLWFRQHTDDSFDSLLKSLYDTDVWIRLETTDTVFDLHGNPYYVSGKMLITQEVKR